jgi:phage terminase large subunit-like protein
MDQYGFHMDDVYQGYNLSPVIMEADGLMRDGKINIGDNDLLKIHLLDCALKKDNESGKSKLVKLNKNAHIDGAAALIDALTVRQKHWGDIGEQLKN